jgi:hypothetical protein
LKILKNIILLILLILVISCVPDKKPSAKNWYVTTLKNLPESITNNAVSEGFIDKMPYAFTFGGLDSTKLYSGIHLRSYRYDITDNTWQQIADLPDTLGKIASAASRIKNTIYILGGYHVFEDHTERSSNKVHRYDILKNKFLEDGASIPVPIDDHVQAVWRDSLIYVITGWSDKENVPNVQIYNPEANSWTIGTPVPDNHNYKSFGASGTIIGDTIFYFGGASMGKHYPIQNILRKGIINVNNPTQIEWSFQVLDSIMVGYRMAATRTNNIPHWLGGSTTTYNYDAVAYDGSGGVNPSNRGLYLSNNHLKTNFLENFSMDLRGIAEISDSTKIIIGGIGKNQKVSTNVYLLEWKE